MRRQRDGAAGVGGYGGGGGGDGEEEGGSGGAAGRRHCSRREGGGRGACRGTALAACLPRTATKEMGKGGGGRQDGSCGGRSS